MSEDKDKNQEQKDQEQPQYQPPPSPTGTLYNYPSGSTANPMSGQVAVIGQALSQLQSFSFQKEPNPEIVKFQYEAVMRVSDNFKEENLRQIDYQESRDVKQHDIITKREGREFAIAAGALFTVIVIVGIGIYLLIEGQTVAGTGLLAGGLGTILGFLGGMGVSKKLPV